MPRLLGNHANEVAKTIFVVINRTQEWFFDNEMLKKDAKVHKLFAVSISKIKHASSRKLPKQNRKEHMEENLRYIKEAQTCSVLCLNYFDKRFSTPFNSLSFLEMTLFVYEREKRLNTSGLHAANLTDQVGERAHPLIRYANTNSDVKSDCKQRATVNFCYSLLGRICGNTNVKKFEKRDTTLLVESDEETDLLIDYILANGKLNF